jgi:hypothetical protein
LFNLPGAEADYKDLRQYFSKEMRIPKSQVVVLRDTVEKDTDNLSRQKVLDGIRSLAGKVDADDNLVIHYSGHGVLGGAQELKWKGPQNLMTSNLRGLDLIDARTGEVIPWGTPGPEPVKPPPVDSPPLERPAARNGYWVLNNGDLLSSGDLQGVIDEIGAGTTYVFNDSCHSQAFVEDIKAGKSKFVGLAASRWYQGARDTKQGGLFTTSIKHPLRNCNTLQKSFEQAQEESKAESVWTSRGLEVIGTKPPGTKKEPVRPEREPQTPVLHNPDNVNLENKPWEDPTGAQQQLNKRAADLFQPTQNANVQPLGTRSIQIVGSWDPNDKVGPDGFGSEGNISARQMLSYVVYFENKTAALAPAQEVLITDHLDAHLDWSTFALETIAFNGVVIKVPAGLQQYTDVAYVASDPNPVDVKAWLDPVTGTAIWTLQSCDLITGMLPEDPFAGFLPPNDATHRGEGYVSFTIRPKPDLADGTWLTNEAVITFDPTYGVNPPIRTPIVTNRIDTTPPSSAVTPLPPQAPLSFMVSWTGADPAPGAGVAGYDIYVARDGGSYVLWLANVSDTSAMFTGLAGSSYSFFSVAGDYAGNTESPPTMPDTTTQVSALNPRIAFARFTNWQFTLTIENLTIGAKYVIERSAMLRQNDWQTAGQFVPTAATTQTTVTLQPNWPVMFFRVRLAP